jgi:hypothetical protein
MRNQHVTGPLVGRGQQRNCWHPRAQHQHGTDRAYRADDCRCLACVDAHRAVGRRRTRAKALGLWQPYQPAEPVRRHVDQLRSAGLGIDQIARLAGIAGSSLRFIVYGRPSDQVKTSTAARILGIPVTDQVRARRSTVDAAVTRLHLRDLLTAGWTYPDLATQLGRSTANLRRTATRSTVTVSTAADIAALHQQLLRNNKVAGHQASDPTLPTRQRLSA